MSTSQLSANHDIFVRDLVRDYCAVYLAIAEQNARFERDASVSFAALHALLGEAARKGVFLRLKDTGHYLFRRPVGVVPEDSGDNPDEAVGALVDWCIGYAFHECCKLREDAFQAIHYASRLTQLSRMGQLARRKAVPLQPLTRETAESCRRELKRILHVLRSGMQLLIAYLPTASENSILARWIATEELQVREAFGHLYPHLMRALYGDTPQKLFTLAAGNLVECGRFEEAKSLLTRALNAGRIDDGGRALLSSL